MAEQDLEQPQVPSDSFGTAGQRLRNARERLGLSRADIAARTKIAERHLAAIEDVRYADLASSTYAVGFSRAYARAVGLDEREIARAVRVELELVDDTGTRPARTFEPGDPARVPSSRIAWLAGLGVLAVIVAVLLSWSEYFFPAGSLPDLTSEAPLPTVVQTASAPASAAVVQGPVVITAKEPGVWVKVTDAGGRQLLQKQLAQGESYIVPAEAEGPQLRTARPDALAVTVSGRAVPPLADKSMTVTVPVSAAALLARGAPPAPATAPPALPAASAVAATPGPAASDRPAPPRPSAASSAPSSPRPAAAPIAAVFPPAEPLKASTVSE